MDDRTRAWLEEDGAFADATTLAVVPEVARARGRVVARQVLVAAGIGPACAVFEALGCKVIERVEEGTGLDDGGVMVDVEGPARALLSAERVALNVVMRLSGIATLTDRVVRAARAVNPDCRVLATRKTTPGLRALEHQAVVAGGGAPHRADLASAVLVKENHLRFTTIAEAVRAAREAGGGRFVMVEAETPEEALEVARAGADGVLLDNFTPAAVADTAELVRRMRPDIVVEASGGITPENAAAFARHVDRISLGALTHSAPAADVSLELDPVRPVERDGTAKARRERDDATR